MSLACVVCRERSEIIGAREIRIYLTHRFPGSQPVSFSSGSLDLLEKKEYVPCTLLDRGG